MAVSCRAVDILAEEGAQDCARPCRHRPAFEDCKHLGPVRATAGECFLTEVLARDSLLTCVETCSVTFPSV